MGSANFSLLENPFHILKATYSSTPAEISALFEDAEFEGRFPTDILHQAQQSLVTPRSRLQAELSWLPELSQSQLQTVLDLLETADQSAILARVDHFPELAKANVAAHLCGQTPATGALLHFLTETWDDIGLRQLTDFINTTRRASGFPGVTETLVQDAMRDLCQRHAQAAAASVWTVSNPGQLMNSVVEKELERNASGAFLNFFVREYDKLSESDLARIETEIETRAQAAKAADQSLEQHISALSDLLVAWDDINQPVQIFEQRHGHEESRSKRIYASLRALCVDLANNHDEYLLALRLSEALLRTFPELESVAEVLRQDVQDLESLAAQQRAQQQIAPLLRACEAAKKSPLMFRKKLSSLGFRKTGFGVVQNLVVSFHNAVRALDDPGPAFLAVRDLALSFNNDHKDPQTAFQLVHWLLLNSHTLKNPEIIAKLTQERAVLHQNWKTRELESHAGNFSKMLEILDEMLEYAQGSERNALMRLKAKLKAKIDRRRMFRRAKYAIFAAIAAFVVYSVAMDPSRQTPARTTYRAPQTVTTRPAAQTSTIPANPFREVVPPVAAGRVLTRDEVRYCIFQGDRLDYMRPLANTNRKIDRFNGLIADYNRRCSNFRYTVGVLEPIRREAVQRAGILRADARRIASTW